jgi:hypothetical protein
VLGEPQRRAADALGISRQRLRTLERRLLDGLKYELQRAEAVEPASSAIVPGRARSSTSTVQRELPSAAPELREFDGLEAGMTRARRR